MSGLFVPSTGLEGILLIVDPLSICSIKMVLVVASRAVLVELMLVQVAKPHQLRASHKP